MKKKRRHFSFCAFCDGRKHSVAYKDFACIEAAVAFYKKQLEKSNVNVISTRVVNKNSKGFEV